MSEKKNNEKRVYFVKGMHCASCEILIEKEISKMNGVDKVDASLKKGSVSVTSHTKKFPEINDINNSLSELGYSVSLEKQVEKKLSKEDVAKTLGVFVLFIASFYLLEKSGIFMRFSVSGNSSLPSYFMFGMLAGLSSCAALVGGLLLSMSAQWNSLYNGNSAKSYKPFIYFNLSRVLAFAVLGGLLGLAGSYISFSMGFSTLIAFLISILMLVIGLQMLNIGWFGRFKLAVPKSFSKYISDETNFKGKYMPLIIGAMTFFVPCGFTLIAQTNAITSGSFVRGALMLTFFSLGTLPVLALISFSSVKFYANQAFAKKFNLFSGMLITFFALYTMNSQLNVLGLFSLNDLPGVFNKSSDEVKGTAKVSGDYQLMQMEATAFEYHPSEFNLEVGVPTRWEIFNNGAAGCANAVYARGLYPSVINLKQGLNVVEFTPKRTGTYKISCSMGMVPPVTVNVYSSDK